MIKTLFVPFTKRNDDLRMVYGYASTEALDSQDEIVDLEAIKAALPDYLKFGNIREMHQLKAVGKAKEADVDEKGLYLGAKVVDAAAWEKCKEGVLMGFSIGGEVVEKVGNRITKFLLREISLVDRPANPECIFDAVKASGGASLSTSGETMSDKAEQVTAKKGLFEVARLTEVLGALAYLQESAEFEAKIEGDASPIPAQLLEQVKALGETLKNMVAEEVAELTAPEPGEAAPAPESKESADKPKKKAPPKEEPKADPKDEKKPEGEPTEGEEPKGEEKEPEPEEGLHMGAKTKEDLQACHKAIAGHVRSLTEVHKAMHRACESLGLCGEGEKCDAEKETPVEGDGQKADLASMAKAAQFSKLEKELDTLRADVARLSALPADGKGVTKPVPVVVSKAEDSALEGKKIEEPKTPEEAIKAAWASGGQKIAV